MPATSRGSKAGATPVSILLSTFNGAAWLPELLDSLLAQTHREWTLWARDDGSHDSTPAVLRDYARRDPRVKLLAGGGHLGAPRSFFRLLEQAPESPYAMFCDQDDVWYEDKIEVTLEAMLAAERADGAKTPLLVHTDMRFVDRRLRPLSPSVKGYLGFRDLDGDILGRLLAQNVVTGCASMLNRSLARAVRPLPPEAIMHDWWCALVAASLGRVVYVPRATMDYRQHGSNASGVSLHRQRIARAVRRLLQEPSFYDRVLEERIAQARALRAHLKGFPEGRASRLLDDYLRDVEGGGTRAVASVRRLGVAMQGAARNSLYYLLLLRRGLVRGRRLSLV
jgi:glycosyltransferase involved in cell wall biosynthesis